MSLEAAMVFLKELTLDAWPALDASNRLFFPGNIPNPESLASNLQSEPWVVIHEPRLTGSGVIQDFIATLDVCARLPSVARIQSDLLLSKLNRSSRFPGRTDFPRAVPITEIGYTRFNVAFTIRLTAATVGN